MALIAQLKRTLLMLKEPTSHQGTSSGKYSVVLLQINIEEGASTLMSI